MAATPESASSCSSSCSPELMATWLHPASTPGSTQWMFLDVPPHDQHRRTEKQPPPQRAFSPDDGAGTVADATELGSRPHAVTGGDEDVHSKFERLSHLERFLHTPATPDHGAPACRPHSGAGGFSPDLAAHLPSFAAASHPGAEDTGEEVSLKLYVEDAELLSEEAVRLLCTRCTHCAHPLCTRLAPACAPSAGCGGRGRLRRRGAYQRGGARHL